MARTIKFTEEYIQFAFSEFVKYLQTGKFSDGKIQFTKDIGALNRKAELHFSEVAWIKMQALVHGFDKEVAWHGTAYRDEDETVDRYHIGDIIMYPQEVTGTNVDTDEQAYESWQYSLDDDTFCNMRMQGHSHVNMGVSPSTVDTGHQKEIIDQLKDDMFYIFLIWNKQGNRYIKIYDVKKGIMFETSDVTVTIGDGIDVDAFMTEAKKLVKPVYTTYYQKAPATKSMSVSTTQTKQPDKSTHKKGHRKDTASAKSSCSYPGSGYYVTDKYGELVDINDPFYYSE